MNRRGDSRKPPCCPKFPPPPSACVGPTVDDVILQSDGGISVCGTVVASDGAQTFRIIFSEAVSGVDACVGGDCPSCNVRMRICDSVLPVTVQTPCVLGSPGCDLLVPTSVVVVDLLTVDVSFVIPPGSNCPLDFFDVQLYVGGVPACPIVNAAGCPLDPFCCNVRFCTSN